MSLRLKSTCWLILLLIIGTPLTAQEIYRVVDQDGNVTYTDQKPDDDADPVNLPEINVLGDDDPLPIEEPEATEPLEFWIDRPTDGEVVQAAGNSVEIEMSVNLEVPPTAQIVLFLNGQPQEPVHSLEVTLDQMPAGEYLLRAELQTVGGRKLAGSDSVRFEVAATGADSERQ